MYVHIIRIRSDPRRRNRGIVFLLTRSRCLSLPVNNDLSLVLCVIKKRVYAWNR